jgi:hypothetical protein
MFLALLLGGVAFHGCGDDPTQPPNQLFFPASWAGVWHLTLTERDCATDSFLGFDVSEDTICAGMSLVEFFGLGDVPIDCSGSITDTRIDATCTGQEPFTGCNVTLRVNADRPDSTISGTGSLRFSACSAANCTEFDILGRRQAPAPSSCSPASNGLAGRFLARGAPGRESLPQEHAMPAPHDAPIPPVGPARNDRE